MTDVLTAGPGRAAPPCRHFQRCGGCAVQHADHATYQGWKLGLLHHALARTGFLRVAVAAMVAVPPGNRRRARFALRRTAQGLIAGFNEAQSKTIIDIAECPVLHPAIVAVLPALRATMTSVLAAGAGCDAAVTFLDGGLDVLLIGPAKLDLTARERLAALAEQADIARLSWQADDQGSPEPLAHRRTVTLNFGNVAVVPPPGGFLQAAGDGERALQAAVIAGIGEAARVADLFCGVGTFAIPLARTAKVAAVDGDAAAVAALAAAVRAAKLPAVTVERRDLFRDPLTAGELGAFDAVVLDPPRQGAAAQVAELAKSGVARIVMVSCSPASFARDARTLCDGGYALMSVQPVDQFVWSAHLELVGVFARSG